MSVPPGQRVLYVIASGGPPAGDLPQALARHPAFIANLAALRSWGVELIFDPDSASLPGPVPGDPGSALFPWTSLVDTLGRLGSNEVASPADRMPG